MNVKGEYIQSQVLEQDATRDASFADLTPQGGGSAPKGREAKPPNTPNRFSPFCKGNK